MKIIDQYIKKNGKGKSTVGYSKAMLEAHLEPKKYKLS